MIEIQDLNQFYGGSHILWDVAMNVPEGSCTVLMGRNGMGKSTLLRCLMGLTPIASGTIRCGKQDLTTMSASRRAPLGIGYVPQGREIFSQLTVEENLRTGLSARADGRKDIPEEIYQMFPVLKSMSGRRGGDLSGGQQQQLAIGRALVIDPKVLILDEPTEGIQPNIVREIGDVIVRLNKEKGITVLLVEQKLPFARRIGTDLRILDKGRLVVSGTIADLTDEVVHDHLTV